MQEQVQLCRLVANSKEGMQLRLAANVSVTPEEVFTSTPTGMG